MCRAARGIREIESGGTRNSWYRSRKYQCVLVTRGSGGGDGDARRVIAECLCSIIRWIFKCIQTMDNSHLSVNSLIILMDLCMRYGEFLIIINFHDILNKCCNDICK